MFTKISDDADRLGRLGNNPPEPLPPIDQPEPSPPTDVLAGYLDVKPFAEEVDRCERTAIRWMDQPGGLPYTRMGTRRLIHVETAREWIFSRIRQPNPPRSKRIRLTEQRDPRSRIHMRRR
jgi:hypothetical protein